MNIDPEYLIIGSIILLASMIQGTMGFGFALIAVPLLSLFLPLQFIIPLIVCLSLFINIAVFTSVKESLNIKSIGLLIAAGILGIPIGVYFLKSVNSEVLSSAVGFMIIITAVIMLMGYSITIKSRGVSYILTGLISGFLNGSISMSGPPVVLFLSNMKYQKNDFRSNLTFYGVITNIITIITLFFNGLLTIEMFYLMSSLLVFLALGSYLGIKISSLFNNQQFKILVLILIALIGLFTIIRNFL